MKEEVDEEPAETLEHHPKKRDREQQREEPAPIVLVEPRERDRWADQTRKRQFSQNQRQNKLPHKVLARSNRNGDQRHKKLPHKVLARNNRNGNWIRH